MVSIDLSFAWKGKSAHILRQKKHIRRCVVEKLNIFDGEVSLLVSFTENGKVRTKAVCPTMIVAVHMLWHSDQLVSSDDEDENKKFIPPPTRDTALPNLECTNSFLLTPQQQRKLKWNLAQANALLPQITEIIAARKAQEQQK